MTRAGFIAQAGMRLEPTQPSSSEYWGLISYGLKAVTACSSIKFQSEENNFNL